MKLLGFSQPETISTSIPNVEFSCVASSVLSPLTGLVIE